MIISCTDGDGQWENVIDITYKGNFFHSTIAKVLKVAGEYEGIFD